MLTDRKNQGKCASVRKSSIELKEAIFMNHEMNHEDYLNFLKQANTCVSESEYIEAIKMLEPLVNSDNSAIQGVISFSLGDIYRCCDGTEDNIHAKEHLSRAIKIASDSDVEDNQVVVAAKAALAQVESVLGNKEKAQQYLQEARDEFQALPELAKWVELKERLEDSSFKIQDLLFLSGCCACEPDDPNIPFPNGRWSGTPPECRPCKCG
ncbi:MAG: hypothetical protein AB4368_17230 [Xenococcaceae cyanobacterium]